MKAISYSRYGGPDVLEYGEVREPKVGPDAVLVKVRAASVNPVDGKCREGHLDGILDAVFPVIPGWDVSGVVVQPGASVTEFEVGDEVIGYAREDFLSRGTFAEYVAAPVRTLARKPLNLSFEEAAGLPLVGLTAYQVMIKVLAVQAGDLGLTARVRVEDHPDLAAAAWNQERTDERHVGNLHLPAPGLQDIGGASHLQVGGARHYRVAAQPVLVQDPGAAGREVADEDPRSIPVHPAFAEQRMRRFNLPLGCQISPSA